MYNTETEQKNKIFFKLISKFSITNNINMYI